VKTKGEIDVTEKNDLIYDSGDDAKSLTDWLATIMAAFPDIDEKVYVTYNDRAGSKLYKSGLDALQAMAKRKDKAGDWSCTLRENGWLFIRHYRPGQRWSVYDTLIIGYGQIWSF
jgi:hypothetical protein